jgi:hypothetical protein
MRYRSGVNPGNAVPAAAGRSPVSLAEDEGVELLFKNLKPGFQFPQPPDGNFGLLALKAAAHILQHRIKIGILIQN